MKVQFIGAAQTVTGSKTYITTPKSKVLIDCGMYQGVKSIVEKNHQSFPFVPSELDYIFLTHGHLDHCGLIPRLYKEGFRGKILCGHSTKKIAEIIMLDSARIQVSDFLNFKKDKNIRKNLKKNKEVLYDENDVHQCLSLFETYDYDRAIKLDDIEITFRAAGHILGASGIEIAHENQKTYFSGDIGRYNDPIENDPFVPNDMTNIFMETTYGDREHDKADPLEELSKIIKRTIQCDGKLLIPSFAVARTQLVLYYLYQLFTKYPDLKIPIYIDSPMTKKVTDLYLENHHELRPHKEELQAFFEQAKFLKWENEYKKLKKSTRPYIIISASGMVSGGRVLKYIDTLARKENNSIALVGYQGDATIGREISEGAKEVRALGGRIPIRAKVYHLHTLSAHADRNELYQWISTSNKLPKKIILMHGEKIAIKSFKEFLSTKIDSEIIIAKENEILNL
jgi:metallo-beta-lactamase family protein